MKLSPLEWETAKRVCTERQIEAIDLWRRGHSARQIGRLLEIDERTVRDRLERAQRRIANALTLGLRRGRPVGTVSRRSAN